MPLDDRVIHSAIRTHGVKEGKRFTTGSVITDPDELVKAAGEKDSGIDLQSLYDQGAISGTWKGVKQAEPEKPTKK
jgi:hypothetical protein